LSKLTKKNLFKEHNAKPETAMEKTTRIVREMVSAETEERQAKNAQLRKARLERDASVSTAKEPATKGRKARTPKTDKKPT